MERVIRRHQALHLQAPIDEDLIGLADLGLARWGQEHGRGEDRGGG